MLKYILIILLPISGCVTQNKVLKYAHEHDKVALMITREYMSNNKKEAAEICLEAFPQKETIDTIVIVKDSIIIKELVDTLYTWFESTHYVDRDKIKQVLTPYVSNKYITRTIYDDRYKILFESKGKDYIVLDNKYNELKNSYHKTRKGLFLTWAWIVLIALGVYLYKRR